MNHIHIVGAGPRTGTTLLAEAIKFCCNIDFASEHEDRLFARPNRIVNNFLTKHPGDLLIVEPSLNWDPNLHVICLIRDPRDAVSSRHGKNSAQYWGTLRYWNLLEPIIGKLTKHARFILVKYEDFVTSPDEIQKRLVEKIPSLKATHPFSNYHNVAVPSEESKKALKSLRPISPQGIGSWKSHLPRIRQQINFHGDISHSLIKYGYEKNNKWLACLSDVAPYEGDSVWPEFFDETDVKNREKNKNLEALRRLLANIGLISPIWPVRTQIKP